MKNDNKHKDHCPLCNEEVEEIKPFLYKHKNDKLEYVRCKKCTIFGIEERQKLCNELTTKEKQKLSKVAKNETESSEKKYSRSRDVLYNEVDMKKECFIIITIDNAQKLIDSASM